MRMVRRVTLNLAETKYKEIGPLNPDAVPNWITQAAANPANALGASWHRLSLLNEIANGTGVDQRIGNRIFVKYVQMYIVMSVNASPWTGTCRYLVLEDKMCSTALADISGNYLMAGNVPHIKDLTTNPSIYAPKNTQQFKRWNTLLDRQHNMTATFSTGEPVQPVMQHYIPIGKSFQFLTGGAANLTTNAQLPENALNFYMAANDAGCCQVSIFFRVAFKDA